MNDVKNEYWQPLPPEVAEWMGSTDVREPLADTAETVEVPVQQGVREVLARIFG